MSENKITQEELKSLLQRGDPAGESAELPPEDRTHLRRRVLSELAGSHRSRWLPAPAVVAAATLTLLVVSLWIALWPPPSSEWATRNPAEAEQLQDPGSRRLAAGDVPRPPSAVPTETAARERKSQQLNFVTPGGTRVIWALNPDFDV